MGLPIVANAPVLDPLKTTENHKVFSCFKKAKKKKIGLIVYKKINHKMQPQKVGISK